MAYSLVTSTVNPSPFPTTFTVNTARKANETSSQAVNIGDLVEESSVINLTDQGTSNPGTPVSTTFTTVAGDVTLLSQDFQNFVDQIDTHIQLFDSNGNIVADNQGTNAQQAAYQQWAGTGIGLAADTYTAVATPTGSTDLSVSTTQQQGTSLQVNSQLTGADTSEYYNFSLSAGNNIKLAYDAGSATPSTRIQLYNSSGQLIADNKGNSFEVANFIALTSANGLSSTTGNYQIKVSYAPGADTTQNINYNFQLYSGSNYAVVYKNNVTTPAADYTATGSVSATANAQLYTRQTYHTINETAITASTIGWLQQNQSALEVLSQVTATDPTDYYSFTLQQGDNLKFGFDSKQTKSPNDLRVQILDSSGLHVFADSEGTPEQQANYKALTTTNGLKASPGNYSIKITYANGAPRTPSTYVFNLYSGTSYNALYKTTSSPQTSGNALLSGQFGSSSSPSNMVAYLTTLANGGSPDIIGALKSTIA